MRNTNMKTPRMLRALVLLSLVTGSVAASAGFLTPVAHQSNVLVMGPGGYRFGDYLKSGLPLDLIAFVIAMLLLLIVWPWP